MRYKIWTRAVRYRLSVRHLHLNWRECVILAEVYVGSKEWFKRRRLAV